jgi:hypothetical protein
MHAFKHCCMQVTGAYVLRDTHVKGRGVVYGELTIVHNDGAEQPLPFNNARISIQDLQHLAVNINTQAWLRRISSRSGGHDGEALTLTPPENDTSVLVSIDLDDHTKLEAQLGQSLLDFQSAWLRSLGSSPALLARLPRLVSQRVTCHSSSEELFIAIEPHHGIRPIRDQQSLRTFRMHMIAMFVVLFVLAIGVVLAIVMFMHHNHLAKPSYVPLLISASVMYTGVGAYYVDIVYLLSAPQPVRLTVARDSWQVKTGLRIFGRDCWTKQFGGSTSDLRGCQVRCLQSTCEKGIPFLDGYLGVSYR